MRLYWAREEKWHDPYVASKIRSRDSRGCLTVRSTAALAGAFDIWRGFFAPSPALQ